MTILNVDEEVMTAENFWQSYIDDDIEDKSDEDEVQVDVQDDVPILVPTDESSTLKRTRNFVAGLILAFLSGLIFMGNNLAIQIYHLDYSDTVVIRGLVQVVVIGLFVFMSGLSLWPKIGDRPNWLRALMVLQGLFGGIMVIATYSCLMFLPLGDALTLVFAAPLSTMVIAAIVFKQPLKLFKITCGLLLLMGTILVVRPPFLIPNNNKDNTEIVPENITGIFITLYSDVNISQVVPEPIIHNDNYYIGVAIALTSTFVDGLLNVAISSLHSVPSLVLLWWAGVGSLFVGALAYSFDKDVMLFTEDIVNINLNEWIALFGIAFFGILAFFCMTRALQMIDPTIVSFVRALEIVVAYVAQITIMHQMPAILSVVGASLVLVSVMAMAAQNKILKSIPQKIRFLF